ncbi:MAG: hypothetical protein M1825_003568 [Sarcosagium campestre]|nr:MAG: hypothetical protein M1825_003568 [Sarcosagium campestre]
MLCKTGLLAAVFLFFHFALALRPTRLEQRASPKPSFVGTAVFNEADTPADTGKPLVVASSGERPLPTDKPDSFESIIVADPSSLSAKSSSKTRDDSTSQVETSFLPQNTAAAATSSQSTSTPDAPQQPSQGRSNGRTIIIIVSVVCGAAIVAMVLCLILLLRRHRRNRNGGRGGGKGRGLVCKSRDPTPIDDDEIETWRLGTSTNHTSSNATTMAAATTKRLPSIQKPQMVLTPTSSRPGSRSASIVRRPSETDLGGATAAADHTPPIPSSVSSDPFILSTPPKRYDSIPQYQTPVNRQLPSKPSSPDVSLGSPSSMYSPHEPDYNREHEPQGPLAAASFDFGFDRRSGKRESGIV